MTIKCKLCKSEPTEQISNFKELYSASYDIYLYSCPKCNSLFLEPFPDTELLKRIYNKNYYVYKIGLFKYAISLLNHFDVLKDVKTIKSYLIKGSILDVGCGNGVVLEELYKAGTYELSGMDYAGSCKNTKTKSIKMIRDSLENISLPDNKFDLIIVRNFIEHIQNIDLLNPLVKSLKPGGFMFIRTPNSESKDWHNFGKNWFMLKSLGHIVFYNSEYIKKYFQENKFALVDSWFIHSSLLAFYRSSSLNIIFRFVFTFPYYLISKIIKTNVEMAMIFQKNIEPN